MSPEPLTHQPRVSVIMGTYNRAHLIDSSIESVRGQTFSHWELIITDDGSSDGTQQVAEAWRAREPRVIYQRNDVNQGISRNYNVGLRLARGEYVAMIDDDDPWYDPEKLALQVRFLDEHPEYVGCGGGMIVVDEHRKELYRYLKPERDEAIRNQMLLTNPMANSTTVFRLEAARQAGLYDANLRYAGDRDFWLKMGKLGKLYNFPKYLSYYTVNGRNTSITRVRPHLKASLEVMRRYRKDYPRYPLALVLNGLQYAYAWLPAAVRSHTRVLLARLKQRVFGGGGKPQAAQ